MRLSITLTALLSGAAIIIGTLLPRSEVSGVLLWLFLLLAGGFCIIAWRPGQKNWRPNSVSVVFVSLALLYGYYWLDDRLNSRLPIESDRSRLIMTLIVDDVEVLDRRWRLSLRVKQAEVPFSRLERLRLSWYPKAGEEHVQPATGDVIEAEVILRVVRQFANPLLFDYEAYQLISGVDAIGYIRKLIVIETQPASSYSGLNRDRLLTRLEQQLPQQAYQWVSGLVFGEGQSFSAEQWSLARNTGTLHLMVVSGLHMGMVTLLGLLIWALVQRLWSASSGRSYLFFYSAPLICVVIVSTLYLYIGGSGVSLQRSWWMVLLLWCLWFSLRQFKWQGVWAMAALLVLIWQPLIYTQIGFQLSFISVALLLSYFYGRSNRRFEGVFLPQILIFIALMPLMIAWQAPLASHQLLTNMLAVPWMTLVVLPLALLASVFPVEPFIRLLESAGVMYWQGLEVLDASSVNGRLYISWSAGLLLAVLFLILWLRRLSFPLNWLLLIVPVLLLGADQPKSQLIMLDVGQGLSVVVADGDRALLFDTGARFSSRFNAAEAITLPMLRRQGITGLHLIVSHSDSDHAGGVGPVVKEFRPAVVFTGQALAGIGAQQSCHQDNHWRVLSASVRYRFFPGPGQVKGDNNHSCVMLLEWFGKRVLFPGDIESEVEDYLLKNYGDSLKADILISPHHGSATSSSLAFLQAVSPQQVWISSGFNNRFNHPHNNVIQRYQRLGFRVFTTATHGAVSLNSEGQTFYERQGWQRPWLYP